jgi:hypothetical protein
VPSAPAILGGIPGPTGHLRFRLSCWPV